jgi:hypothetical protein
MPAQVFGPQANPESEGTQLVPVDPLQGATPVSSNFPSAQDEPLPAVWVSSNPFDRASITSNGTGPGRASEPPGQAGVLANPEPGTLWLFGLGALGLAACKRKRKRPTA